MALGQTFNILEQRLCRVAAKVRQAKLDVIGSGRAAGTGGSDPSQAARVRRLNDKLAGVYVELEQILKLLDGIGVQLDHRERIAWRIGREFRYRERQSIRSQVSRQRELYQLIDDIVRDIDDLLRGSGALTTADIMNLGNGLRGQFKQFAQHIQEAKAILTQPSGPAFTSPNVTVNVDWVTMVFMAFILLVSLREKFRHHDA